MAEIEHVHQAEDQREARRHHEDHHAHREPRDGQRHPGRGGRDERQRGERQQQRQQQRQIVARRLRQRSAGVGMSRSLMRIQAQSEQSVLQRRVGGELRHRAGVDDAAIVHHARPCRRSPARRENSARPAGWWRRAASLPRGARSVRR